MEGVMKRPIRDEAAPGLIITCEEDPSTGMELYAIIHQESGKCVFPYYAMSLRAAQHIARWLSREAEDAGFSWEAAEKEIRGIPEAGDLMARSEELFRELATY